MALPLRTRLTLTMLALALVPLAVTTTVLLHFNLPRLRRRTKAYRLAVADTIATKIRSDLRSAESELAAVGAALARPDLSTKTRVQLASAILLGARLVESVTIYDKEGHLVDRIETRTQQRADGKKGLPGILDEGTRGVAKTEGIAYLGVIQGNRGVPLLPMIQPIFAGKSPSIFGYVGTALDLEPLRETILAESRRRFEGAADRIWIVDRNLAIIAHADPKLFFHSAAKEGIFADMHRPGKILTKDIALSADYETNGKSVLGIVQPIPELGWGIVVEQPRKEAYAEIRTIAVSALTVAGLFALLASLVGWLMGRRLASPVVALAKAAGAVAQGDFSRRIHTKRRDEIGGMAQAFNAMAEDLERFEARVVEETRIRTDLSRYLTADLVEGVIAQNIDLGLGGTRKHVVVLFADVVAFTPLVEQQEPEEVVAVLNELFTFLTEIVFRHGGIVDKFIGDSVMAVFGVPNDMDQPELSAVRAADEMLRWLETGNVRWRGRIGRQLELAIGINAGQAVVGNIGSTRRMEYTVIGDTVNVAARLESLARPGQVLMTKAVADSVAHEFDVEPLGERQLAGKSRPVQLFVLLDT